MIYTDPIYSDMIYPDKTYSDTIHSLGSLRAKVGKLF